MKNQLQQQVFYAAHTLKGVCLNLGLSALSGSAHKLYEALRTVFRPGAVLFKQVSEDYANITSAIRQLPVQHTRDDSL